MRLARGGVRIAYLSDRETVDEVPAHNFPENILHGSGFRQDIDAAVLINKFFRHRGAFHRLRQACAIQINQFHGRSIEIEGGCCGRCFIVHIQHGRGQSPRRREHDFPAIRQAHPLHVGKGGINLIGCCGNGFARCFIQRINEHQCRVLIAGGRHHLMAFLRDVLTAFAIECADVQLAIVDGTIRQAVGNFNRIDDACLAIVHHILIGEHIAGGGEIFIIARIVGDVHVIAVVGYAACMAHVRNGAIGIHVQFALFRFVAVQHENYGRQRFALVVGGHQIGVFIDLIEALGHVAGPEPRNRHLNLCPAEEEGAEIDFFAHEDKQHKCKRDADNPTKCFEKESKKFLHSNLPLCA